MSDVGRFQPLFSELDGLMKRQPPKLSGYQGLPYQSWREHSIVCENLREQIKDALSRALRYPQELDDLETRFKREISFVRRAVETPPPPASQPGETY